MQTFIIKSLIRTWPKYVLWNEVILQQFYLRDDIHSYIIVNIAMDTTIKIIDKIFDCIEDGGRSHKMVRVYSVYLGTYFCSIFRFNTINMIRWICWIEVSDDDEYVVKNIFNVWDLSRWNCALSRGSWIELFYSQYRLQKISINFEDLKRQKVYYWIENL